jgi:hypothetical protein
MNIDPEELLGQLKPRRPGAELRGQVLSAAAGELQSLRQRRWMQRIAFATAALLVFSVATNWWANWTISERIARFYGSATLSGQTAEAENLLASFDKAESPPGSRIAQYLSFLQQHIAVESAIFKKDMRHEKMEENPPLDGNRPGNPDGMHSPSGCLPYMDYRYTA